MTSLCSLGLPLSSIPFGICKTGLLKSARHGSIKPAFKNFSISIIWRCLSDARCGRFLTSLASGSRSILNSPPVNSSRSCECFEKKTSLYLFDKLFNFTFCSSVKLSLVSNLNGLVLVSSFALILLISSSRLLLI